MKNIAIAHIPVTVAMVIQQRVNCTNLTRVI